MNYEFATAEPREFEKSEVVVAYIASSSTRATTSILWQVVPMKITAILVGFAVVCCQVNAISDLYFKFKGLIGLPSFLKFHIMVGFDDITARESYLLDFLPIDAANPDVMAKIISGKSMPGEVRIKITSLSDRSGEVDAAFYMADSGKVVGNSEYLNNAINGQKYADLLVSNFDPSLNIYFNNCYTFALHCFMKDKEVRKMIGESKDVN